MRATWLLTSLAWCLTSAVVGCSDGDGGGSSAPVDAGADGVVSDGNGADADGPDPSLAIACADGEAAIYGDPGALPAENGAILRCATGDRISRADLESKARANGYDGKIVSGARSYRVLYRTERGGPSKLAGYSSAMVYLPDARVTPKAPMVIGGRGSRGQGPKCTPSKFTPEGEYVRSDFENLAFPFVGAGYPVIVPDSAGYANYGAKDNPPSVYAGWDDVGKSMLDAGRAMRKLVPSVLNDDVVLAGLSQGGHTVLSTLALWPTYGTAGTIKAVVAAAPLWLPQRSWGALFLLEDSYLFASAPAAPMVSLWYHYSHAELLDGPGKGLELFKPEKRDGVKKLFDDACWSAKYPQLEALGTKMSDIFDPTFADAITSTAAAGTPCPGDEPKKSLCEKWLARYLADRPKFEGKARDVPVLFMYGLNDTTIPGDRVTCARDTLKASGAKMEWCVDETAEHGGKNGILAKRGQYAVDWIANKTLGLPAPAACPKTESDIKASCNPIPVNE
jgi:pimeloyl-ACP methyl ester carboxylesterase